MEALLLLLLPFLLVGLGAYLFFPLVWHGFEINTFVDCSTSLPKSGWKHASGKRDRPFSNKSVDCHLDVQPWPQGTIFWAHIEQSGLLSLKRRARYRLARTIVEKRPVRGTGALGLRASLPLKWSKCTVALCEGQILKVLWIVLSTCLG